MKEQQYILENATSFEPKHIFDCGQCFRWDEEADASYTGIVKNNVINVKKVDNSVVFKSVGADNLEQLVIDYFDLNRNYEKILIMFIFFAVLIFILSNKEITNNQILLIIIFIGGFLFHFLWEAKSRYIIPYIIILIPIASIGINKAVQKIVEFIKKEKNA